MWRLTFIAVFFVLTLLPGLEMLTGLAKVQTVTENRNLAPPVTAETPIDAVPRVADRWFADHFGLRSLLIQLKTQIDFSIFGMSDRVLVGRDGQLFYRSVVDVEEPAMEELLARKEDAVIAGIDRLSKALEKAGVHMAVVVPMMSDRFYPELLPRTATHRPAHPRIDDLVAKLSNLQNVSFVDSFAILRETMKARRIFHRTDFHWNDPAAFAVGKALVDRMSAVDGRPESAWTHPLRIRTQRTSGGIAMFMPLFVPPSEDSLMVQQSWDWPPGFHYKSQSVPFEEATESDANPRLLPPAVFVGDSYFDGMLRSGIEADFVETDRLRWKPGMKASDIVNSFRAGTHWLVVEFIEVSSDRHGRVRRCAGHRARGRSAPRSTFHGDR